MSSTSSGSWSDESDYPGYSLVPVDSGNSSGSGSCLSSTLTSINSLNVEHCTDFHVGPKIINNNHNQILNEDSNWVTKLADKLIEPSKTGKWRSYRRLVVCLLIVLIALLVALTVVEVMRMRLEQARTGPTPEATTTAKPTTSASHKTEPPLPSTTTTAKTTTTTTTSKPEPDVVDRTTWEGLEPPEDSKRTAYQARFIYFDNIYEDDCDNHSDDKRLKYIEVEVNRELNRTEALEFNFLIDENGTIYEVRGWNYKAEDSDIYREAYKVGFIGEKANDKHVNSLRAFISQSSMHISSSYELIPVCCRDVDRDDERGPDSSFICHIYQSMLQDNLHQCYLDVKNCDERSWIWRKMPTDICGNWDFYPYS